MTHAVFVLLIVIGALVSVIAAFIGGALARHNGTAWPKVILMGGGTFATAMTLSLKVLEALGHN